MGRLTLLLGGQSSGKSRTAATLAAASGRPVVVVTPAAVRDDELAARVARHRAERPAGWRTLETFDLVAALAEAGGDAFVIVDALDTWLAGVLEERGVAIGDEAPTAEAQERTTANVLAEARSFVAAARGRVGTTVVIAGQPGLGAHAMGRGARTFVDLHGLVLQVLGEAADDAHLVVAGRMVELAAPPAPRTAPSIPAVELPATLAQRVPAIRPVDETARQEARSRHDLLAKPPRSLGYLEELGAQLAAIARACPPPVPAAPIAVVAAGDHGVHAQGVSDWPQEVTGAMVGTVAKGGAAVNAIARAVGADLTVLDVGTLTPPPLPVGVRDARVRHGTRDLTVEPAMTLDECERAVLAGVTSAEEVLAAGADLLATGDLGIANTTASACLIAALTGAAPATVVGTGANLDASRVATKVAAVERALARHGGDREPLRLLASLGGLEHAALVGVMLAGAAARVPVVVDGVIAGAAALAAVAIAPDVRGYLIAGHASGEPGARAILDHLGLRPLLDLGMKLGEGTGALLAVPVVRAAAQVLTDTATLEEVVGG